MSWWSLFSCVRLNSTQCVRKHFTAGCCSPHAPSIQLINNEEEELGSRKKRTIILMVRDKDIQVLSRYFKKSIRSHKTQSCTAAPSARLNLAPPGRNHIEHFFHTCLMTSVPIILVYAPLLWQWIWGNILGCFCFSQHRLLRESATTVKALHCRAGETQHSAAAHFRITQYWCSVNTRSWLHWDTLHWVMLMLHFFHWIVQWFQQASFICCTEKLHPTMPTSVGLVCGLQQGGKTYWSRTSGLRRMRAHIPFTH